MRKSNKIVSINILSRGKDGNGVGLGHVASIPTLSYLFKIIFIPILPRPFNFFFKYLIFLIILKKYIL